MHKNVNMLISFCGSISSAVSSYDLKALFVSLLMLILSMLFDSIGKLLTKIFRLNDYQEKNHQLSRTKAIIFLISKNLHRNVNMTYAN